MAIATAPKLLQNRNYLALWGAQAASQIGERFQQIALLWWLTTHGGDLFQSGLLMVAVTLPVALLSPIAGGIVDRWGKVRTLKLTEGLRGLLLLGLSYHLYLGQGSLQTLMGIILLAGVLSTVVAPAIFGLLPVTVPEEQLLKANSFQETTMQAAGILGPALGGMVIAFGGAHMALAIAGISLLVASRMVGGVRVAEPQGAGAHDWAAGFRILRDNPVIRHLLMSFAVLNFCFTPVMIFLPHYAHHLFKAGPAGLGQLEASISLGMIGVALVLGRIGDVKRPLALFVAATWIVGLMLIVMGCWPRFAVFLVALAVIGGAIAAINVTVMTLFQTMIAAEDMGRFMGIVMGLVFALIPVSYGVSGYLTARFQPEPFLIGGGLVMAVTGLRMTRLKL